ncbi:hypothetical protein D3C71_2051480 [compost metagenome]
MRVASRLSVSMWNSSCAGVVDQKPRFAARSALENTSCTVQVKSQAFSGLRTLDRISLIRALFSVMPAE